MVNSTIDPQGRRPRLGWPLVALLLAGGSACAEDLTAIPLEQLMSLEVYSASRFMQKASQAPSTVTVITAADIRAYGWRTLADALRSVRGLHASNDRSYSYLGARGFLRPGDLNTRFLVQIDGTRINDPVFDQGQLGQEFPLDLELVDRIEYVPGPGSSIYGANAFFGVINVITKRAPELEGARATMEAGQSGQLKGQASYAWRSGENEVVLSASRLRSHGQDLYFPEFNGVAQGLDWERATRYFLRGQHGPWSVTLLGGVRDKGIPTASFGQPFNAPGGETRDGVHLAELGYRANLHAQCELTARIYHGAYNYIGNYVNDVPERSINHDVARGRWWGADASVFMQPSTAHKLVFGADYQDNYRQDQLNNDVAPYVSYLDDRRSSKRYGLYAQDEISLREGLLLNAGLRYDHEPSTGGVLNPRLALIGDLTPRTTLKAMYGSAFRAPNAYELYYAFLGEGGQRANPQLDRERIRSEEIALVQQLPPNARLTVSLFYNRITGLIGQVTEAGELPIFRNVGRLAARGIETEYERKFANGASVRASLSHQHVKQQNGDGLEANSPATLAKLNAAARLQGPWHVGAEAQYVSSRQLLDGTRAGAYMLANLNLYTVGLTRHADIGLSAYNLANHSYHDPVSAAFVQRSIQQDGRRLLFRIRFSY